MSLVGLDLTVSHLQAQSDSTYACARARTRTHKHMYNDNFVFNNRGGLTVSHIEMHKSPLPSSMTIH